MPNVNLTNSESYTKFFFPLSDLGSACNSRRSCPELSDEQWVQMGICRSILDPVTGRGFLQQYSPYFEQMPSRGLFFETLKSSRRLEYCAELNTKLCEKMGRRLPDPLADFPELKNFDVYGGDGHWHGAAVHDEAKDGRKWAVGHFYTLDMRSHAMKHLEMADEVDRKHEHDMRALKRQSIQSLRQNAPKGRKVLYAWDSACLDYAQWEKWKRQGGIYFVTRAKENLLFDLLDDLEVDRSDPMNHGIISDQLIMPTGGHPLRRIECEDPLTGKRHVFLTNERTLSAGLLAQIYRMRWDLEKLFDQFKNALNERKAWASSANAKMMQAQFLCLGANLMLLMEHELETRFDLRNEAEIQRRSQRLERMTKTATQADRKVSLMYQHVQRLTKRSVKFIRSLRTFFFLSAPLQQLVDYLRQLYATL